MFEGRHLPATFFFILFIIQSMHMTKCDIIISTPLYKSSHCYDIRNIDNITKMLHYNQAYNQLRKGKKNNTQYKQKKTEMTDK